MTAIRVRTMEICLLRLTPILLQRSERAGESQKLNMAERLDIGQLGRYDMMRDMDKIY